MSIQLLLCILMRINQKQQNNKTTKQQNNKTTKNIEKEEYFIH